MSDNPCPHARSAAAFITGRAIMGREKYGHTLADAGLSPAELVQHAREEAADLLVYLTGLGEAMAVEVARLQSMATLCAAMSAYLAAHDPTGALPDDTAVIETIDNTGGPGVVITAGMIRAAVGEGEA